MTHHSVPRKVSFKGETFLKKNKPKYNQIIEAAVEVIAENGYHASRVSNIADRAGVADGTIYLYFENKEDILVSVFKEKMGSFISKVEKSIAEKDDASDKLYTLIHSHFSQLNKDRSLAIVTQLELRQSKPELRREINNVLKSYLNIIDSIVHLGMENEQFRNDINPKLIRQMIFGTLDETVTSWVMKAHRYSLVDQIEDVHKLLLNGLLKD